MAGPGSTPPLGEGGDSLGQRQRSLSFGTDASGEGTGGGTGSYYDDDVDNDSSLEEQAILAELSQYAFTRDYHTSNARATYNASKHLEKWRSKDKTKTVAVALVLCLNIGVDAPDVVKTTPCAKLECWLDPFSAPPQKCTGGNGVEEWYVF